MKKNVKTRLERLREIGKRDQANRCGICKIVLPKTGVKMRWQDPLMYCSDDCLDEADHRAHHRVVS